MENRKRKEPPSTETVSKMIKGEEIQSTDSFSTNDPAFANVDDVSINDERLNQESSYLANLDKFFPELVWETILGKLKRTSDIVNCSNASPYFGVVLKSKRESDLVLPVVFSVLSNRYHKPMYETYKETNLETIPWNRPAGKTVAHSLTGLWKCRLICKTWNKAFENMSKAKYFEEESFESNEQVRKFMVHFDSTHYDHVNTISRKSPFLGRRLKIRYDRQSFEGNFFHVLEMVRKYGKDIWHLNFSYFHQTTVQENMAMGRNFEDIMMRDIMDFYTKFRQVLFMLPKLKSVKFHNFDSNHLFDAVSARQVQNLRREISRNSLPKLVGLKSVTTSVLVGPIFKELLLQNIQIEQLTISNLKCFSWEASCRPLIEKLCILEKLSFLIYTLQDFELFEKLRFTFRSKRVFFSCDASVPWSRLFNALNNKLDTKICTDLSLNLHHATTDDETKLDLKESVKCELNFRELRTFRVVTNTDFSLNFLSKSLNSLCKVNISGREYYLKPQQVDSANY